MTVKDVRQACTRLWKTDTERRYLLVQDNRRFMLCRTNARSPVSPWLPAREFVAWVDAFTAGIEEMLVRSTLARITKSVSQASGIPVPVLSGSSLLCDRCHDYLVPTGGMCPRCDFKPRTES